MVRSISNDRPTPPRTQDAPVKADDVKTRSASATTATAMLEAQVTIPDSFQPVTTTRNETLAQTREAPRQVDAGVMKEALNKLETRAQGFTTEIRGREMASDVHTPFVLGESIPKQLTPELGMRLVTLQHKAQSGEVGLGQSALDLLKGVNQSFAQQLELSAQRKALLKGEHAAQLQVVIEKARSSLTGKAADERLKKSAKAERAEQRAEQRMGSGATRTEAALPEKEAKELREAAEPLLDRVDAVDVEALAEIVMMECAKDQERDLKDVLDQMKKAADEKAKLRKTISDAKSAKAKISELIRKEYDARTKLDPKNTLYIDVTQVSAADYEKARELQGNLDAVISGDATQAMLDLTNNLPIYKKPETGPVPTPDQLDADQRVALGEAKEKWDVAMAEWDQARIAANVAYKAEYDKAEDVRVKGINDNITKMRGEWGTNLSNASAAATTAQSEYDTCVKNKNDAAAEVARLQPELDASTARVRELEKAEGALAWMEGVAKVFPGFDAPLKDVRRQLDEERAKKGNLEWAIGINTIVCIANALAEPGKSRKLAEARSWEAHCQTEKDKWDNTKFEEPKYLDISAPDYRAPGVPDPPPDPRKKMVTGDPAIDSLLAAAAANPSDATFLPLFEAISKNHPESKQFAAYVDWLAGEMADSAAHPEATFGDTAKFASGLKEFYGAETARRQAAIDKDNDATFKTHPQGDGMKLTTVESFEQGVESLKSRMDTLGDLTQELQLKIQLALDRRSKMYEVLSAIMKKASSTAEAIIQNMK